MAQGASVGAGSGAAFGGAVGAAGGPAGSVVGAAVGGLAGAVAGGTVASERGPTGGRRFGKVPRGASDSSCQPCFEYTTYIVGGSWKQSAIHLRFKNSQPAAGSPDTSS